MIGIQIHVIWVASFFHPNGNSVFKIPHFPVTGVYPVAYKYKSVLKVWNFEFILDD